MWPWNKKKKTLVTASPALVYTTEAAALHKLVLAAGQALLGGQLSIVLAHFDDDGMQLHQALSGAGVPFRSVGDSEGLRLLPPQPGSEAILSHTSNLPNTPPPTNTAALCPVLVLVYGNYPIPGPDAAIADYAARMGRPAVVQHYLGLDSPFFTLMGLSNVTELLQRMGHQAHEAIQHKLVDSSIRQAQEKFAKSLRAPARHAPTLELWFEENFGASS